MNLNLINRKNFSEELAFEMEEVLYHFLDSSRVSLRELLKGMDHERCGLAVVVNLKKEAVLFQDPISYGYRIKFKDTSESFPLTDSVHIMPKQVFETFKEFVPTIEKLMSVEHLTFKVLNKWHEFRSEHLRSVLCNPSLDFNFKFEAYSI